MQLFGRSSSHYTRVTRIFAAELEVELDFQPIRDLMSTDAADYGGNPALKLPTLRVDGDAWFGSLSICRQLSAASALDLDITWPEDLALPVAANAQEMTLQAMATGTALIMGEASGVTSDNALLAKQRQSLQGTLAWLEGNVSAAIASLPPMRDLSYLEVALFCLLEHLEFRGVQSLEGYPNLRGCAERFGRRSSARNTAFRFDFPAV